LKRHQMFITPVTAILYIEEAEMHLYHLCQPELGLIKAE